VDGKSKKPFRQIKAQYDDGWIQWHYQQDCRKPLRGRPVIAQGQRAMAFPDTDEQAAPQTAAANLAAVADVQRGVVSCHSRPMAAPHLHN